MVKEERMKDELARAIDEYVQARHELLEFMDEYLGTSKVLTPEALERWRTLRERDDKTHERMLELFRQSSG